MYYAPHAVIFEISSLIKDLIAPLSVSCYSIAIKTITRQVFDRSSFHSFFFCPYFSYNLYSQQEERLGVGRKEGGGGG